jgi:hypothetical protein
METDIAVMEKRIQNLMASRSHLNFLSQMPASETASSSSTHVKEETAYLKEQWNEMTKKRSDLANYDDLVNSLYDLYTNKAGTDDTNPKFRLQAVLDEDAEFDQLRKIGQVQASW